MASSADGPKSGALQLYNDPRKPSDLGLAASTAKMPLSVSGNITLYRPASKKRSCSTCCDSSSSSSSDESDGKEIIIPAGQPYITRMNNGQLGMARKKVDRPAAGGVMLDLMGHAFGSSTTKVIRRTRSKSLEPPPQRLLIDGIPYVPQVPQPPVGYTVPLPQGPFPYPQPLFPNASFPQGPFPQPPPGGITPQPHFLQYRPPSQASQYPYEPPRYLARELSREENSELDFVNAHYEYLHEQKMGKMGNRKSSKVKETNITITKHVCAQCGRLRSRRFHHDHPIKAGESPKPAFCRKCQKDTSSSGSDRKSKERDEKKGNDKGKDTNSGKSGKGKKKHSVENSGDDDDEGYGGSPARKPKAAQSTKAKKSKQTKDLKRDPFENEYIVVEEDVSEDERPPRKASQQKAKAYVATVETALNSSASQLSMRKYTSPLKPVKVRETIVKETIRRPTSGFRYVEPVSRGSSLDREARGKDRVVIVDEIFDPMSSRSFIRTPSISPPPVKYRDKKVKEPARDREPSSGFRYVEPVSGNSSSDCEETYPKKIPIHWDDDDVIDKPHYPARNLRKEQEDRHPISDVLETSINVRPKRESRRRREEEYVEVIEDAEPIRNESRRTHYAADMRSTSDEHHNNRERRRRERDSYPKERDEEILVAETFEYRPKRASRQFADEHERRMQERLDREMLSVRPEPISQARMEQWEEGLGMHAGHHHTEEDAHRYYQDDWHQLTPPREKKGRSHQKHRHEHSDISESEDGISSQGRHDSCRLPEVPSPPSAAHHYERPRSRKEQLPYPISSSSEISLRRGPRYHEQQDTEFLRRPRDRSTDTITTRNSHKPRSRHSEQDQGSDYSGYSRMTDRERAAEAAFDAPGNVNASEMTGMSRATEKLQGNDWKWTGSNLFPKKDANSAVERAEREAEDADRHVSFRDTPTFKSLSTPDEDGWRTLTPEQADDLFNPVTPAHDSKDP